MLRAGGSPSLGQGDTPVALLEREREFAACLALLEASRHGHGGLIVVEGPPGIGKTQLLRAVRDAAVEAGMQPLVARGIEIRSSTPFSALRAMLEPLVRRPRGRANALIRSSRLASRLFDLDAPRPTPADPDAILDAIYWLVADLAELRPLLLVIDDAHWIDEPSLRVVRFLQPRLEDLPVLVILAARPPTSDHDRLLGHIAADPSAEVMRLRPLSEGGVAQHVGRTLRAPPDPEFVRACFEATGGNPYFVSELLTELARLGVQPTGAGAALVSTVRADGISRALRFRHTEMPEAFQLAQALAILGDGASLATVADLAGLPAGIAAKALDALVGESLVTVSPNLAFTHPIVRGAVYADLGDLAQAVAHRRAAQLLRAGGAPAEEVAAHLLLTNPTHDASVVDVLRAAATNASSKGAPESAVAYLRRALLEPTDEATRAIVLLDLGRAEMQTEDPGSAAHLLEAHATATDPTIRSEAATAAAYALFLGGRGTEAVGLLSDAAAHLADQDRDAALRLEAQIGAVAVFDEAAASAHSSRIEAIDEDSLGGSVGERMMLCFLAYRRMLSADDATRAVVLVERALLSDDLIQEVGGEGLSIAQAMMTLTMADELTLARRVIDQALRSVQESGAPHAYAQVCYHRSVLENRAGKPAAAAADAEASLAITSRGDLTVPVAVASAELIFARIEMGLLEEATAALRVVGMTADDLPAASPFIMLLSARGRLRLATGDIEGGLADLLECGRRKQRFGARNPVFMPWSGDAALAQWGLGNIDAARGLAEEELTAAREWGTPGAVGEALRVAGLVAARAKAVDYLQEAVEELARSPARLSQARAMIDLGAALRRANRRTEARTTLSEGRQLAIQIGAVALRRQADVELAGLGVRVRRPPDRRPDTLTPSERRVAELAAAGGTNREIAQALFVTTKTVEKHMANALSKLNLKSRRQLSGRLEQLEVRP